ncbi:hypothetical protein BU17DRAFT_83854 [Hysterangium stoloniferum]|nr:hypothetical protein BU17DRAFT_83854 [Hysterangium stoloniferum]
MEAKDDVLWVHSVCVRLCIRPHSDMVQLPPPTASSAGSLIALQNGNTSDILLAPETCPLTQAPQYKGPLFTHPEEVVVIIVSHVEQRHDLLSLALTSKIFHRIIIPEFLDHHIRCDPCRLDVWNRITSNPKLAVRIRTLELFDEDFEKCEPIIPFFSDRLPLRKQKFFDMGVSLLATAVKCMTHLRRFRWSEALHLAYFKSLSINLEQLNDIDEFCFGLRQDSNDPPLIIDGVTLWMPVKLKPILPLGNLPNLTTLGLTIDHVPWEDNKWHNLFRDWIVHLTKLKHLRLAFRMDTDDYFDSVVIFQHAYWPFLIELSLEGHICLFPLTESSRFTNVEDENEFTTFLHKHPNLERLRILTDHGGSCFKPQPVSRLRSLVLGNFNDYTKPLCDWFPLDNAQQLQYLECSVTAKCLPNLQAMTSLRVFNAIGMDLEIFQRFVEVVPSLEQLHISYRHWHMQSSDSHDNRHIADTVVNSLLKLKLLVRLEGGFIIHGIDVSENQYLFKRMKEHKRLRHIDSFTREEWDRILNNANNIGYVDVRWYRPRVPVPDIEESAGFYIKNPF